MRFVMIGFADFHEFLTKMGSGTSISDMRKFMRNMTFEQSESMRQQGCMMYHTSLQAGDVLYIPQGFLVAEQTTCMLAAGVQTAIVTPHPRHLRALLNSSPAQASYTYILACRFRFLFSHITVAYVTVFFDVTRFA